MEMDSGNEDDDDDSQEGQLRSILLRYNGIEGGIQEKGK